MVNKYTQPKVAYASISEKGTINGLPGDQTGKEVKVGDYYNFGQSYYFRFDDSTDAWWMCDIMYRIAKNNMVGYGQADRLTLRNVLKSNGWKSQKINVPVNCDCSSLVACAINCIYEKEICPASTTTATLASVLKSIKKGRTHKIEKGYKPMPGDIIWKPGKHVVVCVGYE